MKKELQTQLKKKRSAGELTTKQHFFVLEYLIDLNATQATIRAGYSVKTATEQGSRLLTNVNVQKAIQEAMDKRAVRVKLTADNVLAELKNIAFSNIKDFVNFSSDGIITIKDSEELTPKQAACISQITQVETEKSTNFRFKLHDKLKALDLIAKHINTQAQVKD